MDPVIAALHRARRAEKEQSLFYRALAARAELDEDAQLADDLNGLHADEQHHLSRLTVRLLELNLAVEDLNAVVAPHAEYPDWKAGARVREHAEIAAYEALLQLQLDEPTAALINEILDAERKHAEFLGGKYMIA